MRDANIWAAKTYLKGQDKKYIDWENELINQIEIQDDVCTSDAQGLMELNDDFITKCWKANLGPAEAAKQLLIHATIN